MTKLIFALAAVLGAVLCSSPIAAQSANQKADGLVSVSMGDVFQRGTTKIEEADLGKLPSLPPGFVPLNGKAYRVTTDAVVSGPYDLVFKVTSVADEQSFKSLRIMQVAPDQFDPESPVWVDCTAASEHGPSHDFTQKSITGHSEQLEPGYYMVAKALPKSDAKVDLEVTAKALADSVQMPAKAKMTVTIKNNGPNVATDVGLFVHLPQGEVTSKPSSGTCKDRGAATFCKLGQIAAGSSATIEVVMEPPPEYWGEFSPRFRVGAQEADTNAENNYTEATVMLAADPNVPPKVDLPGLEKELFEQGDTIVLKATASDDDGLITKVEFFDWEKSLGVAPPTDSKEFTLTLNKPANGNHHFYAVATDNGGRTTNSHPIQIFVNGPMKVRIVAPKSGSVFIPGSDLLLVAEAVHPGGSIKGVEFRYTHTMLLGAATPAGDNRFTLHLRDLQRAVSKIQAIATDDAGLVSKSQPFKFSVSKAPTVILTAPTAGANPVGPANVEIALSYTCTNWATRIEIYANDQRIEENGGGGPEGKYSFTWEDVKPGKYTLKAVVYDDLGVKGESSSVNIVVKDRQKKGQ
jgi:hypothetical protein